MDAIEPVSIEVSTSSPQNHKGVQLNRQAGAARRVGLSRLERNSGDGDG